MSKNAREYAELLRKYNDLIRTEYMNEEKRKPLVQQMDKLWDKLSKQEQNMMVEVVAQRLYDEGLGVVCGRSFVPTK